MSSNRVRKSRPESLRPKTVQRDMLVEAILLSPVKMKSPCGFCQKRGSPCEASPSDSRRCLQCVQHTQSFCEAQGVTPQQLRKLSSTLAQLDAEVEKAEQEWLAAGARTKRVRQQRRMWAEKMARAISRGIETVEELEKGNQRVEERESPAALEDGDCPPTALTTSSHMSDGSETFWNIAHGNVFCEHTLLSDFEPVVGGTLSFLV